MSPQIKPSTSAFLFEEGPRFRAIAHGSIALEVDPRRSRASRIGYHVLFVLFGLPAKIIYRGPGAGPQSVDHLEYYPTNRDFVFLRNFKRLLPKLSSSETIDKLIDLVKAFYGEEKAEKVRKYLESWGFFTIAVHDFLSQGNRVVVV